MLRFALFSLAMMIVLVIIFGCKMNKTHTQHIDQVSQVEQFMNSK
jgi:hypothetical protein